MLNIVQALDSLADITGYKKMTIPFYGYFSDKLHAIIAHPKIPLRVRQSILTVSAIVMGFFTRAYKYHPTHSTAARSSRRPHQSPRHL